MSEVLNKRPDMVLLINEFSKQILACHCCVNTQGGMETLVEELVKAKGDTGSTWE